MSKYKICKFIDGNGHEWYQILKKGWLFYSYLSYYEYNAYGFPPLRTILKFYTIEEAKKHIQDAEVVNRTSQIKKVECFDYGL